MEIQSFESSGMEEGVRGAQAFEMLDGDCVYEQSIAAGADDDGGGDPLLHLWKGDANATCLAEFGLAA